MMTANGQCINGTLNSSGTNEEEKTYNFLECTCNNYEGRITCDTMESKSRSRKRKRNREKSETDKNRKSEHFDKRNECPVHDRDQADMNDNESEGFWYRNLPTWCFEPEYMMAEREKRPHEVHQNADSLFSTSSGFTNYRGLLNLGIILLVLGNARLVLENIMKYGILIDPISWLQLFLKDPYNLPNFILICSLNIFVLSSLALEKLLAKGKLPERVGLVFQVVNILCVLVYPATAVYILHTSPVFSVPTMGCVTILTLKLISYHCVNRWWRDARSSPSRMLKRSRTVTSTEEAEKQAEAREANEKLFGKPVLYPDNINLPDICYFVFAPTLCYELNFPRSARIRKRFLMKRFIEIIFLSQLMMGLTQQWVIPLLNNSMQPLEQMNVFKTLERLLKLALPNHFIWLIFFYWFFHSILNALAEILRFGDRVFYHDWWNAETVADFWKNWNVPVHRWAIRHLYKPMLRQGFSKMNAAITVFFVSAFFHEYLLSIPLKMFKVWAFMAMLGQVPLAVITAKYMQGKSGNMVVWLSLILGQPIAILAYVHDYYIINWVIPLLNNSMQPLEQMNVFKMLERLLKLALPNHFIWLIFFYWFFHSILNALAEILRFGDRVFYHDWWNAETVADFWKNWNVPVHRWAIRHLYKPMLRQGFSKMNAAITVFFVSAFFHEYLLSIPLKMFKVWAFMAMLGQVPLAVITAKYMQGKSGNMVVWLSLILGQPIAILAYVHDYYIINVGTLTNQTISIG